MIRTPPTPTRSAHKQVQPCGWWTYRRVDEVKEIAMSLVGVEQGGRLGLHRDAPLPLHLELVQHLLVLLCRYYRTYLRINQSLSL